MEVHEDLTRSQMRAVEAEARRVCVAAGPGAGKTGVLVRRVADRVESGRARLDGVLALTFTENAAGEMKQRLARRFLERGRENERRQVEQTSVSTIHSFCARLLRERPIEAGVDPRFRVLDELEAGLLKARQMAATLDRWRDRNPQAYAEFARHFNGPVQGLLLDVYNEIRRLGADPQERAALLVTRATSGENFDVVEDRLRKLEEGVRKRDRKYREAVRRIQECVARARCAAILAEKLEGLNQASKAINLSSLSDPDLKPSFRALRSDPAKRDGPPVADSLAGLMALLVEEAAAGHRRCLAEALAEFDRDYTEQKRRISALDFEDLERHARDLLSDDARARDVGAQFQEILVDEYQDTSAVQAAIIGRLAAHAGLFVVGDPKQSIYAFRNAEPKNFDDAWNEAPETGRVRLLEDFRSRPEIVAAVNTFFSNVPGLGGALGFEALEAGAEFAAREWPSVEVLISTAGSEPEERRYHEAGHLARRIRALIEGGSLRITNRDRKEDYTRPLHYGDVAVLFRSTSDMAIYEGALRDEGIPYFAETGRGFYDAREVADVVNFLRVLDNARDEIALAAVLRSPLCAISDDALFLLALPNAECGVRNAELGTGTYHSLLSALEQAETLGLAAEDLERARCFREIFALLRDESGRRPLDSLVREIVAATGYEDYLLRELGESKGARHVANLRKLADIAGTLSEAGFGSPGEFARTVDQLRIGEVREGQAQLTAAGEGGKAVRLMTMHAAKGLEFPVVVLPDLSRQPNSSRSSPDFSPEFGLGFEYLPRGGGLEGEARATLSLLNIHWQKQAREDLEANRVLFVAATRAMEHLLLSASGQNGDQGAPKGLGRLGDILEAFRIEPLQPTDGWQRRQVGGFYPFEISLLVTNQAWEKPAAVAPAFSLCAPAEELAQAEGPGPELDPSDFAASVTDVMEFEACPRRYYLGRYLGFRPDPGSPGAPGEDADSPAEPGDEFPAVELGEAVHELLAAGGDASAVLETLPESARPKVERLARRFTESELGRRVAAMKGVAREEPIYGVVDGHFLEGKLDLHSGGLIVDYKAGAADERYRLQMLLYALLSGATEAVLFYLAEGRAVPVELAPEALEEARAAVRRFFDAQRTLNFPAVVKDHCFACPFSGNLCREPQRQRNAAGA